MNIDQQLEAIQSRRMHAEDRFLDKLARQERDAEHIIGTLVREGARIWYINQRRLDGTFTGKTVDFTSWFAAFEFIVRNRYI